MAAILSAAFPQKAPQFLVYLRTITKASRTFGSTAWASYDMAYRQQAANRGSLDWAVVDAALYNEAFAGQARSMLCCKFCLADTHASQKCPCTTGGHQDTGRTGQFPTGLPNLSTPPHCRQGVWRSVSSSTPPGRVDADLPTADMLLFAQSADAHTLWQSVVGRSVRTGQGPLTQAHLSCLHCQNEL